MYTKCILTVAFFLTALVSTVHSISIYHGKIVNGTDTYEHEFPFMVSLRRVKRGNHFCGASIINRLWLLTAAHCVHNVKPSTINAQYGSHVLDANTTQYRNISRIVVHQGYSPTLQFIHDIAILKLEDPLTFNENVQSVHLPKQNQISIENNTAVLIGWGLNATGGSVQKYLQKVELQIFSDRECSERHMTMIHTTNICAGIPEGGKGQCSGDSGGPLLINNTQIGIVSWSRKPCTVAPYPGVFTETSAYIKWIWDTIIDEYLSNDNSDESFESQFANNLIIV